MAFSVYDLLTKLVPGSALYFSLLYFFGAPMEYLPQFIALFPIYLLGYLNETASSILERNFLFKLFWGNPAEKLLDGKGFSQIRLYDPSEAIRKFESDHNTGEPSKIKMFTKMYSIVSKTDNKRVTDFLANYNLSRNLFFSSIFSSILIVVQSRNVSISIVLSLIAILLFIRSKQRNYWFCKEVIESFIHMKNK